MALNSSKRHEESRRLLVHAIASARANEINSARHTLERVLHLPSSMEQKAEAYFWLSEITEDLEEQRDCLEKSIGCYPAFHQSRRKLAILDGKIEEKNIVDPDNVQSESIQSPLKSEGRRFVCPTCGGRMSYSPDGVSLICEYCNRQNQGQDAQLLEQDFIVGIAKSAGHSKPEATQAFECSACGAVFVLAPETLSLTCPHCDSAYAITKTESRDLIPPQGIFPFIVDQQELKQLLIQWFKRNKLTGGIRVGEIRAVYLPVWTFDISGMVKWSGYTNDEKDKVVQVTGSKHVFYDDILIPASDQLPYKFQRILSELPKKEAKPYSPDYTANWLAESYKISMVDCAIKARGQAFKTSQKELKRKQGLGHLRNLSFTSTGLLVESYKLILVPVWIGSYHVKDTGTFGLTVDGYTGQIISEKPPNGLKRFGNWLKGE